MTQGEREPAPPHPLPECPPEKRPRHVAIIMDGNGRWANEQGRPRLHGHREGARTVRRIVEHARRIGLEVLTLYSFSNENWKRPKEEVEALMELCRQHLVSERPRLLANDIRLRRIGRDEGMPASVLEEIRRTEEATAGCTGMTLVLAINYGARQELVDAFRTLAGRCAAGSLAPDEIDESAIESALYTRGLPDPDLLIRTAGEHRISNYLLWQVSYAEFLVLDRTWPEFDEHSLNAAIEDFAERTRRFGGVPPGEAPDGDVPPGVGERDGNR